MNHSEIGNFRKTVQLGFEMNTEQFRFGIFADSDPGSQNVSDPTDPDPKHWSGQCFL